MSFSRRFSLTSIATATLASALLSTVAGADTLYTNANGYTLTSPAGENAVLQQFSSILVDNGKIKAIGGDELNERYSSTDDIVNLQGKTVLPGLIDAHGHVLGLGSDKHVHLKNWTLTETVSMYAWSAVFCVSDKSVRTGL